MDYLLNNFTQSFVCRVSHRQRELQKRKLTWTQVYVRTLRTWLEVTSFSFVMKITNHQNEAQFTPYQDTKPVIYRRRRLQYCFSWIQFQNHDQTLQRNETTDITNFRQSQGKETISNDNNKVIIITFQISLSVSVELKGNKITPTISNTIQHNLLSGHHASMMHASLTRHFCVTCFKIVALDPVFHRANLTLGTRDFELILQFSFLFFFLSWTLWKYWPYM